MANAEVKLTLDTLMADSSMKDLRDLARQTRAELDGMKRGTEEFANKSKELGVVRQRMADITQEMKNLGRTQTDAKGSLEDLRRQYTELEKAVAKSLPDTTEWQEQVRNLQALKKEIGALETSIKGVDEEITHAGGSLNALRKQADAMEKELNGMTRGTEEFANKSKALGTVRQKMEEITREIRGYQTEQSKAGALMSRMGQMAQQAGSYMAGMFAVGSISNFVSYMQQSVVLAAKISDQLSDVQKSAGMSANEVRAFVGELQKLETRTSLGDLLGIAKIAGQLGIAKKDMFGFVEAVDMAVVALGDEFTGGAEQVAKELGILKSLFKDTRNLDAGEALTKIGSAINALGASGSATGPVMADFAARIGALPGTIAPSIQNTLGLGAALEEAGLTAEIAAGGLSKVFTIAGENSAKFAQQIGISEKQFKDLFNQDSNAAILRLAESFKGLSNTELIKTMHRLDIGTNEAIKVMGILSNSTDTVRARQALANAELTKGTSLAEEFNVKNSNMAAELEKSKKAMEAFALMIGNTFYSTFGGLVRLFTEVSKPAEDLTRKFDAQQKSVKNLEKNVVPLLTEYDNLANKTDKTKEEQARLKEIVDLVSKAVPMATGEIDKYGKALTLNTKQAREFIKEQQAVLAITNKEAISAQENEINRLEKRIKNAREEQERLLKGGLKTAPKFTPRGDVIAGSERELTKREQNALIAENQKYLSDLEQQFLGHQTILKRLRGDDLKEQLNDKEKANAQEKAAEEKRIAEENAARAKRLNDEEEFGKKMAEAAKERQKRLEEAQRSYQDRQDKSITNEYDRRIAEINTAANRELEEVKKNGFLVTEQTMLIELDRTRKIAEVNKARIEAEDKAKIERANADIQAASKLLEDGTNITLAKNEEAFIRKREQAQKLFEAGRVTELQRDALLQEAEAEREQADYDARAYSLQMRLDFFTLFGMEQTTEAQKIAAELVRIEAEKNGKIAKGDEDLAKKGIETAKKAADAKKAIQDAQLGAARDFLGLTAAMASENSDIQKGIIVAQGAVAIAEVIINLQRELAAINAAYAAVPPVALSLSAYAKIRSGLSIGTIVAQTAKKFEKGGLLEGPSHANGGIRGTGRFANIEVEGKEFVMNTESTANNLPILEAMNANPKKKFAIVANGGGAGNAPAVISANAPQDMSLIVAKIDALTAQIESLVNVLAAQGAPNVVVNLPLLNLQKELDELKARQKEASSKS